MNAEGRDGYQQAMLTELALSLSRVSSWDELKRVVTSKLKYLLDFHRLDLSRIAAGGHTYSIRTLFDPRCTAVSVEGRVPIHVGITARALALGRPEVCSAPTSMAMAMADPTLEGGGFAELLSVPFFIDGAPAGVLLFAAREPLFDRVTTRLAGQVAAMMGPTVRRLVLTEDLQRSNEALTEFAQVASHDLRAPARRMLAFSKLLAEHMSPDDSEGRMMAQTIMNGARDLSQLVDDVLQYSRAGEDDGPTRPLSLMDIAWEAADRMSHTADEAGASVAIDELPIVRGSSAELVRVMQNLLGNAIKFRSKERDAKIRIFSEQEPLRWKICVEDNGIGLPPGRADDAFAPFRRLHGESYLGSGIGLTACRKIVEHHGGKIWLEPREDAPGTRVWFTLPTISTAHRETEVMSPQCGG